MKDGKQDSEIWAKKLDFLIMIKFHGEQSIGNRISKKSTLQQLFVTPKLSFHDEAYLSGTTLELSYHLSLRKNWRYPLLKRKCSTGAKHLNRFQTGLWRIEEVLC